VREAFSYRCCHIGCQLAMPDSADLWLKPKGAYGLCRNRIAEADRRTILDIGQLAVLKNTGSNPQREATVRGGS